MRYNNDHQKLNTAKSGGFTLVELLIVVSFIAILASITVPNLISSRARASEAVIVQLLKTLNTGQQLLVSRGVLDLNKNATAEYGFIGELAGIRPLRGVGEYLDPPSLNASVGSIDPKGFGTKGGYVYRLYLPDASGVGVPETAALLATVDPGLSESYFTVLAWPATYGSSGQRTFFMNQSGEIVS
ncbi:MAG: type IV pilin protein, partial [Planctomycetota bacterium]